MCKQNSQTSNQTSALIAMSGGIDSTVAVLLAMRDGFDCTGAVMKLFPGADKTVADAHFAAAKLEIPLHVCDFTKPFAEYVIEPFISAYQKGHTPNPCVFCNKHLKFGSLLNKALELGKDFIITGHYAQMEIDANGRYLLKKGIDQSKDQSYVLYSLTQEQLARVRFPVGGLTKSRVREFALDSGLIGENNSESQDICFIPDGDYFKFITKYTGSKPDKGKFIDTGGNYLGESRGVSSYTIGQRRGLGLAMPHPPYVVELRPKDNTVVIGKEDMLYSKSLTAGEINLIAADRLDNSIKAQVKIRYSDPGHSAVVRQTDDDRLHIEFDEPQRAITKGQAAVIYDRNIVLGGGTIM